MSAGVQSDERYLNRATLSVAIGPLARPVLTRVVAMMAARADCPVDRLDDALVAADTIAAHAPRHSSDGHLHLTVGALPGALELRIGPLLDEADAQALIDDADVPGLGNVLERLTDELRVERDDAQGPRLVLTIRFG